jgi:hypothetical protein
MRGCSVLAEELLVSRKRLSCMELFELNMSELYIDPCLSLCVLSVGGTLFVEFGMMFRFPYKIKSLWTRQGPQCAPALVSQSNLFLYIVIHILACCA